MKNKNTIELRNAYREIYSSTINIKNKHFQPINVEYSISEYRGSKLLTYKYEGYDEEFKEYDFGMYEVSIEGFNVPIYLEAGLDFIYIQIKLKNNDIDFYNKIDEQSMKFLNFFESKLKENNNG